jgi:hypothetical protein
MKISQMQEMKQSVPDISIVVINSVLLYNFPRISDRTKQSPTLWKPLHYGMKMFCVQILEKLIIIQLVMKFVIIYGTQGFIPVFTGAHQGTLS